GEPLGEAVGCVEGLGGEPTGPLPRLASTMTPTDPRSRTMATAIAAGISHAGRSDGARSTGRGRGGAGGLRAGPEGIAGLGRLGDDGCSRSGSCMTGSGSGAWYVGSASPVPRGSAGAVVPGLQTGCSIGVHVGCGDGDGGRAGSGAGEGSAGAGVG